MNTTNNRAKLRWLRQEARLLSMTDEQVKEAHTAQQYIIYGKHNQTYEEFKKAQGV